MISNEAAILLALFMFSMGVGATALLWLAFEQFREHRPPPGPDPAWRAQPQFLDGHETAPYLDEPKVNIAAHIRWSDEVAVRLAEGLPATPTIKGKAVRWDEQPTPNAKLIWTAEDPQGNVISRVWDVPASDTLPEGAIYTEFEIGMTDS